MNKLPPQKEMWNAVVKRDRGYEGIFFLGVRTTGIFCRPGCPARTPLKENVEFFHDPSAAMHAGYRACQRCKPLHSAGKVPTHVEMLRKLVEADPATRLSEQSLVGMGIDPSTARRQFKRYFGMTFHAYQRARRMGSALATVRKGANMLDTQLDHGFESSSGFREAFAKLFGTAPSKASGVNCLMSRWIESPLGPMLAIADDRGLHIFDWVDRRGLERAIGALRKKEKAVIVPGEHPVLDQAEREIGEYFAGKRRKFDVKLAHRGTDFQRDVWARLLKIPAGETRSYADLAVSIGKPTAVRAVARANGDNFRGIIIPCHRVIGSDGSLTGYGGGLARKQWLLDFEKSSSQ